MRIAQKNVIVAKGVSIDSLSLTRKLRSEFSPRDALRGIGARISLSLLFHREEMKRLPRWQGQFPEPADDGEAVSFEIIIRSNKSLSERVFE